MKLVVITQRVDPDDPALGATVPMLRALADFCATPWLNIIDGPQRNVNCVTEYVEFRSPQKRADKRRVAGN